MAEPWPSPRQRLPERRAVEPNHPHGAAAGGERARSRLMGRILTLHDVEAAIRGGSVFAAGGGGWVEHGRVLGTTAVHIGRPELVAIEEVPDDAYIATAAAIGAPAGTTQWQMLGVDY